MAGAIVFVVFPGIRDGLKQKRVSRLSGAFLAFALCLILGTLFQQWWLFYVSSIFCGLVWAGDILQQIDQIKKSAGTLGQFIRQNYLSPLMNIHFDQGEINKIFSLMGVAKNPKILIVIHKEGLDTPFKVRCSDLLSRGFPDHDMVAIEVSEKFIAYCVGGLEDEKRMQDQLECIIALDEVNPVTIGMSSCVHDGNLLGKSLACAMSACHYGLKEGGGVLILEQDITHQPSAAFPEQEISRVVQHISGKNEEAIRQASSTVSGLLKEFCEFNVIQMQLSMMDVLAQQRRELLKHSPIDLEAVNKLSVDFYQRIKSSLTIEYIQEQYCEFNLKLGSCLSTISAKETDERISKAMDYIHAHYRDPIGLEDIAKSCYISVSYLKRLFKEHEGDSVMSYVQNYRIERAKELIRAGKLNLTQIAFEVGFSDSNYFSTVFKKTVGVAPSKY